MGTGKEQAELWGPGARDWSDYNEPMCTPFSEAVLDETQVGPGTTLLDVGCGGGFAMLLAATAGLTPLAVNDVPNPLIYPDLATAARTQLSSGPARAAIQHSGIPAVRGALTRAFAGSRKPDGSYRQENVFRYLVART